MIEVQGAVEIGVFFLQGFLELLLFIVPLLIFRSYLRW